MKLMGKLLVWILALLITLSLVGCNAPNKAEAPEGGNPNYPNVNAPMSSFSTRTVRLPALSRTTWARRVRIT